LKFLGASVGRVLKRILGGLGGSIFSFAFPGVLGGLGGSIKP
jgi:hypothetical protein